MAVSTSKFRFVLPSVGDLIFVLLLISLSTGRLASKLLGDAGIGWHIRTGELILATHSIPRVDSFSSTMSGKPWYAWEWLFDVCAGVVHHAAGLNGVVFGSALLIALTFALMFRMLLVRGANLLLGVLMILLTVSASTIHMLARPHVISWLFTVIWFDLLKSFEENGERRRLLWLPVMMLAWVNLHGGFLVGLVLLGIFGVAAWGEASREKGTAAAENALVRARFLAEVGVLCLVATLANPYGYRLHFHIYRYLTDHFLMGHIDEFLSPNFHGIAEKCFVGLVLVTIVGVAVTARRLRTSHILILCFAVYAGLYSSRNLPVSSMLLVLVMAPVISKALGEWATRTEDFAIHRQGAVYLQALGARISAIEAGLRGHAWPIVIVVLGIWTCLQHGQVASRTLVDAKFDANRFPVQAVDFIVANHVREPVFSLDSWGGYLIYRLYPQNRAMVDDRHDLYGDDFLKKYLNTVRGQPQWNDLLMQLQARWVLVPRGYALANLLKEVPEWRIVYEDKTAILFGRATGVDRAPSNP